MEGGAAQRHGGWLLVPFLLPPGGVPRDEPLAALDPMIRSDLQRELRDVFARLRKTVLFVTHDMGEAAYMGGEIALLRAGRVVQRGTAEDLIRRPVDPFVTEFIRAQRFLH